MHSEIQLLNNMLFLSLKEEIENLGDESIYIPNLTITFNIQIEISDKNTEFTKIETREIKPPSLKNKILVEYIIEELRTRLKEDIEKAIEKNLYNKILETQGYYSGNLSLTEKINTLLIDKKRHNSRRFRIFNTCTKKQYKYPKPYIQSDTLVQYLYTTYTKRNNAENNDTTLKKQ